MTAARWNLPLRGYPGEPLVIALVLASALALMHGGSTQDDSRLALTQSLVFHGSVTIGRYGMTNDRAYYRGRLYTDKAPGVSFAAALPVLLVRAVAGGGERVGLGTWRRWALRVLVTGPFFLLLVLLAGRVAESLAAGTGAISAVAVGLGTLLGPLAPTLFGHVPAAALSFGAFFLAWRSRTVLGYALAGLCAGVAVVTEYQSGIVAFALLAYVAARGGRALAAYVAGVVPPALVLAAYNIAAFGSPFRLSYQYVANDYAEQQRQGFFGIGLPMPSDVRAVLVGGTGLSLGRGILVTAPVLLAAAAGLVLLWRRGLRAEVLVCAFVGASYVVYNAGYFEPYGGTSPGPRFLSPAIPFVVMGLPLALAHRRMRIPTVLLTLVSIGVTTLDAVSWFENDALTLRNSSATIWSELGLGRTAGELLVFATAAAAAFAALHASRRVRATAFRHNAVPMEVR